MSETERLVRFELLGQEYKFYTASSEEELRTIFSMVRQLVETNSPQTSGTLPVGKVAILACLNIASRHVKLMHEFEGYKRDSEERIIRLNEEIRSKLLSE
ncbi:cell division protein ZapA [Desulfopila sp. IMCC35006]|uniref:cell division protein ZapA n=1 Tax=Desulfopila sp. IMCC35006 TaxID=2569542 RepID=UPI0010AC9AD9|nr:cell division protein ZapA [Desulfopila sp. IMCC35006]TKB24129.1 cell division protein ZapA [Desulfopila sp. IMCC35006]